jgi:glycosidase
MRDSGLLSVVRQEYQKKSRHNARTPMQWDNTPHGGFTSTEVVPWMSSNPNYARLNSKAQIADPTSAFNCWKSVLEARKKYKDIVIYGNFNLIDEEDERVFAYTRESEEGQVMLVACNFSSETVAWEGIKSNVQEVVLSNNGKRVEDFSGVKVSLSPYEAFAVLL